MAKAAFTFSGEDALNYETYLGPLLFEPSSVEFLAQINSLDPGSVLEIAAGTGRLTNHLQKYFTQSTKITATDASTDMLDVASRKLNNSSIEFQVADAQQLPFPDESFDLVVCQYGIMFLPDKQKGFNEAFRVLKPGGRFIFSTWDSTKNIPLLKLIFDDLIIPFFKEEDSRRLTVPFSLHNPEELNDFLLKAGFTNNKVLPCRFKSGMSSAESIVNGFFLKHPLSRTVAEKDSAAVHFIANEMLKRVSEQFGPGQNVFDLRAFIGSGHR